MADVHSEVRGGSHFLQGLKCKCTRPVKSAKEEDGILFLVSTLLRCQKNESAKNICYEKATCHEVVLITWNLLGLVNSKSTIRL